MNKVYKFKIILSLIIFSIFIGIINITDNIKALETTNENQEFNFDEYNINTNANYGGDMNIRSWKFTGANRANGNSNQYQPDNSIQFVDNGVFKLGFAQHGNYNRQVRMATSDVQLNLKRDIEIIGSFNIAKHRHGFVFALHQQNNFNFTNTGGSLGVYYDPGYGESKGSGLPNAFIMEVDSYPDNGYGDNNQFNDRHMEILDTDMQGRYGKVAGGGPYGTRWLHERIDENRNELFSKNNSYNQIYYRFKWHPTAFNQGLFSIEMGQYIYNQSKNEYEFIVPDDLKRFSKINGKSDNLNKMLSNGGKVWVSIGGSTETDRNKDYSMEVGMHKFGYTDLNPKVHTEVYDDKEKNLISNISPGQKIVVLHKFYNGNNNLEYDVNDNLDLKYVFLQFLTDNELNDTNHAKKNIDAKNVKLGTDLKNLQSPPKPDYSDTFGNGGKLPIYFPARGKYYYVKYDMIVPDYLNSDPYYKEPLFLYFSGRIGRNGYSAVETKFTKEVRLKPKVFSGRPNGINETKEQHEVYKYSSSNNSINKEILIDDIWKKIKVTSIGDINAEIRPGTVAGNYETNGTRVNYKYYYNGKEISKNDIPTSIEKGNAITLSLEVVDKVSNLNLKNYFDRTLVFADSFSFSNDGNYVIYGNNNSGDYKETKLSNMSEKQFTDQIINVSKTKSIKRDYDSSHNRFSIFTNNQDIKITKIWNTVNGSNFIDFNPGTYNLNLNLGNLSNININSRINVLSNTFSIDDGINDTTDSNTGYVIIPTGINVFDDENNTNNIIGESKLYLSNYNTNKSIYVWTDKIINLLGVNNKQNIIKINSKAVDQNLLDPSPNDKRVFLGEINKNRKVGNPLKVKFSGNHLNSNEVEFRGRLTFYFERKR